MTENKTYSQLYVDLIINKVMNIKNDFIRQVDEQLSKLQNLPPIVEPVEPEPEEKEWRQKPRTGEEFFYITYDGIDKKSPWSNRGLPGDIYAELYDSGNCFPCKLFTEEQVQQIAWQNQLNTLLYQYAIVNNALASKEERTANGRLYWVGSPNMARSNFRSYPNTPIFNNQEVVEQAVEDVVEPFCEAHPEFVW